MKSIYLDMHHARISKFIFVALSLVMTEAQAADATGAAPVSAQSMLTSFASNIPNLMQLLTAFTYVLGMFMIIKALYTMRHIGELRTQVSREHSIWPPIIQLFVGTALLYLPTSVQVGLSSFWTEPNPYAYLDQQNQQWTQFLNICYTIVQFVGVLAFIRGLVMLTKGDHGQGGGVTKAMAHIIGGIFCINIYQVVQMMLVTFGIDPTSIGFS